MSDYEWRTPDERYYGPTPVLIADVADGVTAELYVYYQDGVRVSLDVQGDGVVGGRASTDKTSEWPEVERLIPRAEWPEEIYAGVRGPAERTPDEAVTRAIAEAVALWEEGLSD